MASSPEDDSPTEARDAAQLLEFASLTSIEQVLDDPATSGWLKAALMRAISRDPVDALNDALVLAALLEERLRIVLDIDGDPPNECGEQ